MWLLELVELVVYQTVLLEGILILMPALILLLKEEQEARRLMAARAVLRAPAGPAVQVHQHMTAALAEQEPMLLLERVAAEAEAREMPLTEALAEPALTRRPARAEPPEQTAAAPEARGVIMVMMEFQGQLRAARAEAAETEHRQAAPARPGNVF